MRKTSHMAVKPLHPRRIHLQGTELLELLQKHDCDTLVIGGVMTNLCCETTAR